MKEKKSLQDIEYEYLQYLQQIEDYLVENDTDVIPEEFWERLNINQDELEHKLYNYYLATQGKKGEVEVLQAEIDRLKSKVNRKVKTIDFLKSVLVNATKKYGKENDKGGYKIESSYVNISAVKTQSVNIIDGDLIPTECCVGGSIILKFATIEDLHLILSNIKEHFFDIDMLIEVQKNFDKASIKEALNSKQTVPGAELIENHYPRFS